MDLVRALRNGPVEVDELRDFLAGATPRELEIATAAVLVDRALEKRNTAREFLAVCERELDEAHQTRRDAFARHGHVDLRALDSR